MAVQDAQEDVTDGTVQPKVSRQPGAEKPSPYHLAQGSGPSPASSRRRSPGPTRRPPPTNGDSGQRSPGPRRGTQPTSSSAAAAPGSKTAAAMGAVGATKKPDSGSKALYRYRVLTGNESVLLTEALARRPWWEAATGGAGDQRWNLWAGLNGQRFNDFGLLPSATGGSTPPPSSRRLVNRLQEHRVICTKSGLAALLTGIQRAACGAAAASSPPSDARAAGVSATPPPSLDTAGTSSSALAAPASWSGSRSGSGSGAGARALDISWIPETYVVPAGPKAAVGGSGGVLGRFRAAFERHAVEGRRVWIAKPTSLNRGNGIEVFDSLERILEHLRSRPEGSNLILQKYIERPLLLGGRKFDIRAYVLVGPDGGVWFHREAYCRTSSTPYDSNDLANRSAHLTNDAVQKHLDSYNAYEDHCKLSLEQLGPALRTVSASSAERVSPAVTATVSRLDTTPGSEAGLWGCMRRCVAALFSAAVPLLNPRRLTHCFELLGLDFMLDEDGGVYLIEVNTSPALFRAGAYLTDLLPRLVEEVVQKVVDPLFPPSPCQQQPPREATRAQSAGQAVDVTEPGVGKGDLEGPSTSGRKGSRDLLDGFVRVDLDERFGEAAAAAAGASAAGKGPSGVAAAGAVAGRGALRPAAGVPASSAGGRTVPCKSVVAPGQGAKGLAVGLRRG